MLDLGKARSGSAPMEVLPDHLVRECLLRVPYTSHDDLKAVCRSWEAMVSNPQFYADRKISGKSEQLICLIQHDLRAAGTTYSSSIYVITVYDPVKGTWERLSPIDDPNFAGISTWCQCVAVNRKLVLIGGVLLPRPCMRSVYIYDFESRRWSRGADMPIPRACFACSVSSSNGLIYVAGGIDESNNPLAAAATYNVEEDRWEILPPMIQPHGPGCHGVFMEGKFVVLGGGKFDSSGEVFDPREGTWRRWEGIWSFKGSLWRSCAAASSGNLYMFFEKQVLKYDGEKNVWTPVASILPYDVVFTCTTQWRDWTFVSTTCFDMHKPSTGPYLFNPSTGRLIKVKGAGRKEFAGDVVSAATVEI